MQLVDMIPSSIMNWNFERILNNKVDHEKYGLKPKHAAMAWVFLFLQRNTVVLASDSVGTRVGKPEYMERGVKVRKLDARVARSSWCYVYTYVLLRVSRHILQSLRWDIAPIARQRTFHWASTQPTRYVANALPLWALSTPTSDFSQFCIL